MTATSKVVSFCQLRPLDKNAALIIECYLPVTYYQIHYLWILVYVCLPQKPGCLALSKKLGYFRKLTLFVSVFKLLKHLCAMRVNESLSKFCFRGDGFLLGTVIEFQSPFPRGHLPFCGLGLVSPQWLLLQAALQLL